MRREFEEQSDEAWLAASTSTFLVLKNKCRPKCRLKAQEQCPRFPESSSTTPSVSAPPRPIIIGTATILLFALGLQFVPQFNLLNYYYALACAFVVPFVVGLVVTSLPSAATPKRDLLAPAIIACMSW